jgi:hypothetical protein
MDIVVRSYREAPRLFRNRIDKASNRQIRIDTAQPNSNTSTGSIWKRIISSYPDDNMLSLLSKTGTLWKTNPLSLLQACSLVPDDSDTKIRMFMILRSISEKQQTFEIARRILCVAFSRLHGTSTNLGKFVEDIHGSLLFEKEPYQTIKEQISRYLKIGRKWTNIGESCNNEIGVLGAVGHGHL